MAWHQRTITLHARPRGVHLVTGELLAGMPEIEEIRTGLAHVFMQHTSASLAINEAADPEVRADLRRWLDRAVPEDAPYWRHTLEGPDDMPAHVKAVLSGASVSIPIRDGQLALGRWQGLYLLEHRDRPQPRTVVVTVHGQTVDPTGAQA